jgi:hypothetical protein
MLVKTFASTVILAFVAGAEARGRPMTYTMARSPATYSFGVMRRSDGGDGNSGYLPEDEVCNQPGDTCAAACGTGYEQCVSTHCYNPSAGDICCAVGSGDACEAGHYCAHDSKKNTICCPENMDIEACQAALSPNDPITEDIPKATTTPASTKTSSTSATTTSSSSSSTTSTEDEAVSTSSPAFEHHSSSVGYEVSSSPAPVASPTGSGSPGSQTPGSTPPPSESVLPGSAAGNKAALVLAAGFFVALL